MPDLANAFADLKQLMLPFASQLEVASDTDQELSLNTRHVQKNKTPLWFGGVQIKKNYVSYHLMPVYINPELLADISPALRKRMQGKSCFNFKSVDEPLFQELAQLTQAGFDNFQKRGYV